MQIQSNRSQIEQILKNAGIGFGEWARTALLERAPKAGEDGGIDWMLTTEMPATVFDWNRWEFVQEILLADGMRIPANRKIPLLDSHNRSSAFDVLGHVRDFQEADSGKYAGRMGRAFFASDPQSQIIMQKVLDGHLTDGSVGYVVNKSVWVPEDTEVTVKGRNFKGPVKVSHDWSLKEFSPTPIGADVLAKVRLLCGSKPQN